MWKRRGLLAGILGVVLATSSACSASDLNLESASIDIDQCRSATYFDQNTQRHFVTGCMERRRAKFEKLVQHGGNPFWLETISRDLLIFYYDNALQNQPIALQIRARFDLYVEALRRGKFAADQVGSERVARRDDRVQWMRDVAADKAEEGFFTSVDPLKYNNEIKSLRDDAKMTERLLNPKAPSVWSSVLLAAVQASNSVPYTPSLTSNSPPLPIKGVSAPRCSSDTPECEAVPSTGYTSK